MWMCMRDYINHIKPPKILSTFVLTEHSLHKGLFWNGLIFERRVQIPFPTRNRVQIMRVFDFPRSRTALKSSGLSLLVNIPHSGVVYIVLDYELMFFDFL